MEVPAEFINLKTVITLTMGFALASLLGYFSHLCRLSSLLGYLIAGYIIGPYSPGFVGDMEIAEQLSEVGVILMMFGVGLHFKLQDLLNVKKIAIPGAILQTLFATIISVAVIHSLGWPIETGLILGIALGVASTVTLIRVLTETHLLFTNEGHIAVGWLIVEDIITVIALLFVPTVAASYKGNLVSFIELIKTISFVFLKFILLGGLLILLGKRVVKYILTKVMLTKSHELFTVTILGITFIIALGSTLLFSTSIVLGAFLAGMVIGQTHVRHQASSNALPLKDAFLVIFFLSVGMLFNPKALIENWQLFLLILSIVLIAKPFIAFVITYFLKYPLKTAFTIAIALAQIGEFSFILAEEAMKHSLLPDAGFDVIVGCAIVSIAINPLLFRLVR